MERLDHGQRVDECLAAVVIRTPRLELRPCTEQLVEELYEVAAAGIHPPAEMPFAVAWTDTLTRDSFVEFHLGRRGEWTPEQWACSFATLLDGRVIGTQELTGVAFSEQRVVGSGSWLGREWHGQGLGTEQRAAVLEFAFRVLEARAALSGALVTNRPSQRVSEKLGYRLVGEGTLSPRGVPVRHLEYRLEASDWQCPYPVAIEGQEHKALFGA